MALYLLGSITAELGDTSATAAFGVGWLLGVGLSTALLYLGLFWLLFRRVA